MPSAGLKTAWKLKYKDLEDCVLPCRGIHGLFLSKFGKEQTK